MVNGYELILTNVGKTMPFLPAMTGNGKFSYHIHRRWVTTGDWGMVHLWHWKLPTWVGYIPWIPIITGLVEGKIYRKAWGKPWKTPSNRAGCSSFPVIFPLNQSIDISNNINSMKFPCPSNFQDLPCPPFTASAARGLRQISHETLKNHGKISLILDVDDIFLWGFHLKPPHIYPLMSLGNSGQLRTAPDAALGPPATQIHFFRPRTKRPKRPCKIWNNGSCQASALWHPRKTMYLRTSGSKPLKMEMWKTCKKKRWTIGKIPFKNSAKALFDIFLGCTIQETMVIPSSPWDFVKGSVVASS